MTNTEAEDNLLLFCRRIESGKFTLVVEEHQPAYIEEAVRRFSLKPKQGGKGKGKKG